MSRRILILTVFYLRHLAFSLAGVVYAAVTLVYWVLLFPPGQGTPHPEYYVLVVGAFGPAVAFLSALTVASRANRAESSPILVRLASRVESLTGVVLAALLFALALQGLLAVLALIGGPTFSVEDLLTIPPTWLAANVLAAVLAVHASDLVAADWSRVYIFGILAILLFGQTANDTVGRWLSEQGTRVSQVAFNMGLTGFGATLSDLSNWFRGDGTALFARIFGFAFWPFRALSEAVSGGSFTPTQALAPAIILLYASILFMLAAEFFANKDLELTE